MRALLVLPLLLAGCLGAPDAPPVGCDSPVADCPVREFRECPECLPTSPPAGSAPDLPVGRSFTYADEYLYDSEDEITIVVAEKDADGYLFAGASEDDVVSAAVWGRPWFGRVSRDLNAEGARLFSFPLEDGKKWDLREGFTLTARAAEVRSPAGAEPGFVIEGASDGLTHRMEYAPSVGYFTSYTREVDGAPFLRLTLRTVDTAKAWVSWVEGPGANVEGSTPPAGAPAATLDVPAGFDAVLASAGGRGGGRATVAPPGAGLADAWSEEFAGEEEWRTRVFAAEPGAWSLAAGAPPGEFGFARVVAVKWVRGAVAP